jgi:hypothetical protein
MREGMQTVLVILAVVLLAVNVVATVVALRAETSTTAQRILQSCVVWLIPVLGAFAVVLFHRLDRRRQGPEGERASMDGSEIDVGLAVRHDGHH